jgi:hypothetical protein
MRSKAKPHPCSKHICYEVGQTAHTNARLINTLLLSDTTWVRNKQMNVVTRQPATFDLDKRNLNKLREAETLCGDSVCLCQVTGFRHRTTLLLHEAKLCPTVKLIAATVCRTTPCFIHGPHVPKRGWDLPVAEFNTHNSFHIARILGVNV